MAGEWIKMRGNLWDDPRVGSLADACDVGEAAVIGALYWLWATADQHTEDGVMPGLSRRQIDRKTGVAGFGDALANVGWIADHPEGLLIVKFEEHNGASAKRRCMEAQRKANARNASASDADNMQTYEGQDSPDSGRDAELEKRREEKKENSSLRSEKAPRKRSASAPSMVVTVEVMVAEGVDPAHARDWLKARGKHPLTPTAWDLLKDEADKAGITPARAVEICAAKSWRGFDSTWDWPGKRAAGPPGAAPPNRQEALELRNRAAADEWVKSKQREMEDADAPQ